MKSWWTKFRISSALDARKPLSKSLRKRIAADPELKDFTRRSEELDILLQRPQSGNSTLHDDIMQLVRKSRRRDARPTMQMRAPLMRMAAIATMIVFVLLITHPHPAPPRTSALNEPFVVLEISENASAAVPSAVIAPLDSEWAKVNSDVKKTTAIIAATFPFQIQ